MEWICKDCGKVFSAKNKLDTHRKESGEAKPRKFDKTCPRCGEPYVNYKKHRKICAHRFLTKEELHTIHSNAMKKAYASGNHKGWAYTRQNVNGMSYPEKWFKEVIENEFSDKKYEYNLPFYRWKLDFAWIDKRRCIEIDGSQHNEQKQKLSDIEKDKMLHKDGWEVLRLDWDYVSNNTKEAIKIAKNFIEQGIISDIKWESLKTKKKRLHELEREKAINEGRITKDNKINKNGISIMEFEKRKQLILNCGVDVHKFGWVSKVTKATGLSKHQILDTVRHFNLDVYQR